MSEIGRLTPRSANDLTIFHGYIRTLDTTMHVRIEGDPTKVDERAPSHDVFARGNGGSDILVGRAWLKRIKNGAHVGDLFLSISIDDPSLKAPLNVAAFKDQDSNDWVVLWRRRVVQTVEASPSP